MPNQRYNVLSEKTGRRFVATLSVELDGVQAWKWNSERVIIFQLVILQCSQGVNNAKDIRAHIIFQLNFWNCGAFEELVKDTFNAATGLGKARGIQSEEQHHHMFSDLVLKGKLREAVRFFYSWETGEFFNPMNLKSINGLY